METQIGTLGLIIPVPTQNTSTGLQFTPEAVMTWRNRLPMADTGATANQVYHALRDCNMVILSPKDRFQILELFRTPVQFICQSLRKHYLHQTDPLNDKKLMIVKLAQTLQLEMANGYKLILEQLAQKPSSDDFKTLSSMVVDRILHYFNHVLLRSYHLYSTPPLNLWKELTLLYQISEKHRLLDNEVLANFKHILIMAGTDPYKWRQSDQDALFNAGLAWANQVTIKEGIKNDTPGIYRFEIGEDKPPYPPTTGHINNPKNSRLIEFSKIVEHLKQLVALIEPDELRARIDHSNDPEYSLSLPVLQGLIQEWDELPSRETERVEKTTEVQVCIGLSALHYYISGEKPFQPQQEAAMSSTLAALPTLSIQEDANGSKPSESIDLSAVPLAFETKKTSAYSVHKAMEVNESVEGYGLLWQGEAYPPLQAGELIGIKNIIEGGHVQWTAAMIRWLKHPAENELRMGVKRLGATATAGSAQIMKEGKPAGYFLRCLILDTGILTPTIPFKSGSQVLITKQDGTIEEIELLKIRSATGSYKLFDYRSKEQPKTEPSEKVEVAQPTPEPAKKPGKEGDFDSIWSNL